MEHWETFLKKLVELMGFHDYRVEIDEEHRHGVLFLHDHISLVKDNLPLLVQDMNHLIQLVAKKNNQPSIFIDINNYRREREGLISELARAAARKVTATGQEISLPAMNSYERRLVHLELAAHPDIITESSGIGRSRYVTVRPIEKRGEEKSAALPASEAERQL